MFFICLRVTSLFFMFDIKRSSKLFENTISITICDRAKNHDTLRAFIILVVCCDNYTSFFLLPINPLPIMSVPITRQTTILMTSHNCHSSTKNILPITARSNTLPIVRCWVWSNFFPAIQKTNHIRANIINKMTIICCSEMLSCVSAVILHPKYIKKKK